MYQPLTDDELEEKYRDQLDDTDASQYAYFYGMHLYEIAERYDLIDIDVADAVLYWLRRYLAQEETKPDCVKKARYIVAKLSSEFPELREEYKNAE